MKAPLTWPKSSLSSSSRERLGQLTVTKAWPRRGLCWWMARAMTLLPVPLSPSRRMVASLAAARDGEVGDFLHRRGIGLEVDVRGLGAEAGLELGDAILEPARFFRAGEDLADLLRGAGLGEVIERAAAHGLDGGLDGGEGGDNDDREARREIEERREEIEPALLAELEIEEGHVEPAGGFEQCDGGVGGGSHFDIMAEGLDGYAEGIADIAFVINDEDAHIRARLGGAAQDAKALGSEKSRNRIALSAHALAWSDARG